MVNSHNLCGFLDKSLGTRVKMKKCVSAPLFARQYTEISKNKRQGRFPTRRLPLVLGKQGEQRV